jgi:hypothetical protein
MKQPESITAKLERIACDYRHDMEVAIDSLNTKLENSLNELVEEFGTKAAKAAVDEIEDNLSIDWEPQTSLQEALNLVPEFEPDEELEDA